MVHIKLHFVCKVCIAIWILNICKLTRPTEMFMDEITSGLQHTLKYNVVGLSCMVMKTKWDVNYGI